MPVTRSQMDALLKRLEGPVKQAFEKAMKTAQGRASIEAMIAAIISGDENAIWAAAGMRDGMWTNLTETIRSAYVQSGAFYVGATIPKNIGMEFSITNPRAEAWLRNISSQLITGDDRGSLFAGQREAIQVMLQNSMAQGINPRTTALDIIGRIGENGKRSGGVIGLTGQQADYVLNMADDLVEFNERYFDRALRDKRFDKMVRKSFDSGVPLPEAVRNRIVQRYENRMLKHRGDNIARTETLKAINAANDAAMHQVVDEGLAPANAITKIWRHSFSKNERPGHLAMSGEVKKLGEAFTNPVTKFSLQYPGDSDEASEVINCRCYIENKIDFFAVEVPATAEQASAYVPAFRLGSTSSETVDQIFDALGEIPGVKERLATISDFVSQRKIGTVFFDEIKSIEENTKQVVSWAEKYLNNSPLRMELLDIPKNVGGLTDPGWDFIMVQSKGSIIEGLAQTLRDVKRNFNFKQDNAGGYTPLSAWLHELGHQIHFKATVPRKYLDFTGSGMKSLTVYGETNSEEFFAEHFVLWAMDRKGLVKIRPEIAEMIDVIVGNLK